MDSKVSTGSNPELYYNLDKVLYAYIGDDMFPNFYINLYNFFEKLCDTTYRDIDFCTNIKKIYIEGCLLVDKNLIFFDNHY